GLLEGGNDLVGLALGDAGIVGALLDEEGFSDFTGVGKRGGGVHPLAEFGVAFVAVFDAAEVAPVALGVFEEGAEVGDTDDAERAGDAVAEPVGGAEGHVAAVAAAANLDAIGVEVGAGGDP